MCFETIPRVDESLDGSGFRVLRDRGENGSSGSCRSGEFRMRAYAGRLEFGDPGVALGMIERLDPVEHGLDGAAVFTVNGHFEAS